MTALRKRIGLAVVRTLIRHGLIKGRTWEERDADLRADGSGGSTDGWPTGDPCPECGDPMDVGAVGNPGETITWQQCEDCGIGWGPYTGHVDLDAEEADRDE